MGSAYWGTGLFAAGARLVVDFAVDTIGVRRLEARAATVNGRGNGALAKVGAVREAVLRQSFDRHGRRYDQHLWSILADDWRAARAISHPRVHCIYRPPPAPRAAALRLQHRRFCVRATRASAGARREDNSLPVGPIRVLQ